MSGAAVRPRRASGPWLMAPTLMALLAMWQLVASLPGPGRAVPGIADVVGAFVTLFTVGYPQGIPFYTHLAVSLARIVAGVALGAAGALIIGFPIGWFPSLHALARPVITVARGIPAVALIPLAIAWLGIDETSKVALILYATFWIMLTHVVESVRGVDADLVRAGQAFGLTSFHLFRWVVLPAVFPRLLTGLRLAIGIGFAVVVTAEMVGTVQGMGAMLMDARRFYRADVVIVGMMLIGVVGFVLSAGLARIETRWTRWAAVADNR